MTATEHDKQSFLAYNSWLGQRGLNKVSFATYTAMFASSEPPAPLAKETQVETTYVPIEDPKDPALPAKGEASPATATPPKSALHLICWLDTMPDAANDELYTKIKKATCVPLSYMTSFTAPSPSENWQLVVDALGARRPALAIWGPCDLPPEVEALASSVWRMPHPSTFAEPGVKATFWQQLKDLMATVAQHPEI